MSFRKQLTVINKTKPARRSRGQKGIYMIALPTREGWTVSWYTGEVKPRIRRMKDGTRKIIGEIRFCDSYESTSKEAVLRKKKELEDAGFEIEHFGECIF